jgi:diguanylate cyclase (GGDEF)-like protein
MATEVLDALPDATAVLDARGTIVAVNRIWQMFAWDNGGDREATGVGASYLDICDRSAGAGCEDARSVAAGLRAVLAAETLHSEFEYPCPSPTVDRWFLLRITPLGGPGSGAVASHVNITRRKAAERVLAHAAAHDPLTDLANRTEYTERLTAALLCRPGWPEVADVGVLYLDLDGFKAVNDGFGHDAGDEVLCIAATRLRREIRPGDLAARIGGDEFAVCAPRVSAAQLDALAERTTRALGEPYIVHGCSVDVPASVGAHLGATGTSVEAVMQSADAAMYAAKRGRRSDTIGR